MKKLMTAFAACMVAGFVSAEVASQNVVGYSTVGLEAGKLFMLGSNFEKVGTSVGEGVTLSGLMPSVAFEDFDAIYAGVADELGVVQFTNYIYLSFNDPAGWYLDDYATFTGDVALPAGASVWMQIASAQDITASGQVRSTDTQFVFEANKLTMSSSAYPIPFNPNTCTWADVQDFDSIYVGLADELGVVQFTNYLYLSFNDPAGWYLDDYSTYAESIAGVGAGFWVQTAGAVTMTQPSPL